MEAFYEHRVTCEFNENLFHQTLQVLMGENTLFAVMMPTYQPDRLYLLTLAPNLEDVPTEDAKQLGIVRFAWSTTSQVVKYSDQLSKAVFLTLIGMREKLQEVYADSLAMDGWNRFDELRFIRRSVPYRSIYMPNAILRLMPEILLQIALHRPALPHARGFPNRPFLDPTTPTNQ